MSEPLDMVVGEGRQKGGKFAKGHKFGGYASEINRLAKKMRFRLVKLAAQGKNVETLHGQLMHDATDPSNPGAVRVAAAKVLLGYCVGKPDQTLNVELEHRASHDASLEEWVERLTRLGVPPAAWPLVVREHHRKEVASRVIEGPKETT
jgi:hypothetical protein